ncbi:MAG: ABC transporter ATP-binding protein [Bacteroidota bacterium]|jgi:phospholipid/cholesterol/gamma-HCH transport system ATP-binding protein
MSISKAIDIKKNNLDVQQKECILSVKNLYIGFGEKQVLKDFNLDLFRGESLAVLGKSGSGKSVLIKCIIGLLKPDSGEINVLGNNVSKMKHHELDGMRKKVGFLFQSNALYDSMSVKENLEFPLRRHRLFMNEENTDKIIKETLDNVGLLHTLNMMPSELSGGMKKRIALARTLVLNPEIILYDEPTTGLDPVTAREISSLIIDLKNKFNTSSLVISHDMSCVKMTADRIIILLDGKCYANGTYHDLSCSSDTNIHQFFKD